MIDLSADMGEGSPGEDDIWPLISSANIACGGHTGDASSMRKAVEQAAAFDVSLGAHPSYPDRLNFGRKSMHIEPAELKASLVEQIAALRTFGRVVHVKAHGALYNDAYRDRTLAWAIVDAIREVDPSMSLVAPARSQMVVAARSAGVRVVREAFADRRYEADGSLVSRSVAGSTLTIDEAAEQAALLADAGVVIARDGSRIAVPFDTICVHSDMPGAVERLQAIRERLVLD